MNDENTINWLRKEKVLTPSEALAKKITANGLNHAEAVTYFHSIDQQQALEKTAHQKRIQKILFVFSIVLFFGFGWRTSQVDTTAFHPFSAQFRKVDWRLANSSGIIVALNELPKSKSIILQVEPSANVEKAYLLIESVYYPTTNSFETVELKHAGRGDIHIQLELHSTNGQHRMRSKSFQSQENWTISTTVHAEWTHESLINGKWAPTDKQQWPCNGLRISILPTPTLLDQGGAFSISKMDFK